ncbi:MAG: glycosyltransferase family 2 protein [Calditrichaeota bacterium]|nr:MAG: glycosyltransferase family 2 protein [Calditrichota bacterium]
MKANAVRFNISIVIVSYKNAAIIEKMLFSLSAAVEHYAVQLIIIDNHSEDGTEQILKKGDFWHKLHFQDVSIFINEQNTGYTRAVNQGLAYCQGEYLLLLNPDIFFVEKVFSTLISCFNHLDIGVVAPQMRFPDGRIQPSCRHFPRKRDVLFEFLGLTRLFPKSPFFNRWRMPEFDHLSSQHVDQPQGAFLLMRRSVLESVGLLDERFPMFFSDVDWCSRVIAAGWKIHFCAEAFVYHQKGASIRQKRAEMAVTSHRSFIDYFDKNDRTIFDRMTTLMVHVLLLAATAIRLLAFHLR